jgi:hypothetical protein
LSFVWLSGGEAGGDRSDRSRRGSWSRAGRGSRIVGEEGSVNADGGLLLCSTQFAPGIGVRIKLQRLFLLSDRLRLLTRSGRDGPRRGLGSDDGVRGRSEDGVLVRDTGRGRCRSRRVIVRSKLRRPRNIEDLGGGEVRVGGGEMEIRLRTSGGWFEKGRREGIELRLGIVDVETWKGRL